MCRATTTDFDEPLRYPVRRDGRDAIGFYGRLLCLAMALVVATFLGLESTIPHRHPSSPPSFFGVWLSTLLFAAVAIAAIRSVWERLAAGYELSKDELLIDYGYQQLRVPLSGLSEVHAIQIHRSYCPFKLAFRLKLARPVRGPTTIDITPANPDGFLDELAKRCPHLVRDRQRIVPSEALGGAST